MGDRKPTQFFRDLCDTGVRSTLWLDQLPSRVQVILAIQRDQPLDKVADLADAVLESTGSQVVKVFVWCIEPSGTDPIIAFLIGKLTRPSSSQHRR